MIELRKCKKQDRDILFKWANDELVRKNAFNNKIISYDEHCEWFKNSLESTSRNIFIIQYNMEEVGMIRVDINDTNKEGIISYLIGEKYRGMGLGEAVIRKISEKAVTSDLDIVKLIGFVKKENIISRKIFLKCGYNEEEESENFKYTLKVY